MDRDQSKTRDSHDAMKSIVLRGTAGAFVVRGLAAVAGLGMNVILARTLALADYGVVALGLAWLTISGTIACFGTDTVALRFVSEGVVKKDYTQVAGVIRWTKRLALSLGLVGAVLSVCALLIVFGNYTPAQRIALSLIVSATPLFSVTMNQVGVLRGVKRVVLGATIEMLLRPMTVLLTISAIFLMVGRPIGIVVAAFAVVLGQALSAIAALRGGRSLVKYSDADGRSMSAIWIKVATPIAAMNIMSVLIGNIDTIAIGYFINPGSAGTYRASAQLANLVAFGLIASNGIVAPMIAELFSGGRVGELRRMLRFSVGVVSIGSLASVVLMATFGRELLGFFGAEYKTGYEVLLILLIGQTVNSLCGPTGFVMSMTGNQNQAMQIFAISTTASIFLNLLLIPSFGLIGGAIANVVGVSLWNFAILVFLRRKLRLDPSILSWISTLGKNRNQDDA